MAFLKLCMNVMNIRTSKFKIFLTLLKFQNLYNLINVFNKNIYYCFLMCFLYFSKVWWVLKNEGVTFLVVPPNHTFTQVVFLMKKVHFFADKINLIIIILFMSNSCIGWNFSYKVYMPFLHTTWIFWSKI